VSDIAKEAGVRRATVYTHFPTDLALIDACSAHWFSRNPPPDPATWSEIHDPAHRAPTALSEMYAYYHAGERMLENVLRDAPLVTALDEILQQKWWPMIEGVVEILAQGWNAKIDEKELRAGIRVALNFFTWQTLAASGLSNDEAARLSATWIGAGGGGPGKE
jgi:AcrR family transcriptional regulator